MMRDKKELTTEERRRLFDAMQDDPVIRFNALKDTEYWYCREEMTWEKLNELMDPIFKASEGKPKHLIIPIPRHVPRFMHKWYARRWLKNLRKKYDLPVPKVQ